VLVTDPIDMLPRGALLFSSSSGLAGPAQWQLLAGARGACCPTSCRAVGGFWGPSCLPVGGGGATDARRRWLMQLRALTMRSRAYSACTTSPAGRPRAAHRSTRLRYPITLRLPLRVFLSFFLPGEYNHGQRELLRSKSIFSRVL
jgi:hypothetical protein